MRLVKKIKPFPLICCWFFTIIVSACSANPFQNVSVVKEAQPQQPAEQPIDLAQAIRDTRKPSPLSIYNSVGDFKAVAVNETGIQGAGAGELSLLIAEREALRDCTRRSEYQGECETSQVGNIRLSGSDEDKDLQRWQYVKSVHQRLAQATPLSRSLRPKVLAPGSQVGDAVLWLSGSFENGGYAALQMPAYSCSGTLDPIDQSGDEVENEDKPVGLIEMACQSGQIFYGGYASLNASTQLFYLEDPENERWEFMISEKTSTVGFSYTAFKKLFTALEELD